MAIFYSCLFTIIPLYLNILLGFIAGKCLEIHRETIARLMLYVINPLVIFNGVLNTPLEKGALALPIIVFAVSSSLCLLIYQLSHWFWRDSLRNLAAFSAGSGNTGYFGLPLALLLLDERGEGLYIMALLGVTLYENTVGFYVFVRGRQKFRECLKKLVQLPALYVCAAGLAINASQIPMPNVFVDFMQYIKGAYTVFGMMIIGLGLASLSAFKLDLKFISLVFLARFILWPLIALLIIFADIYFFNWFDASIYQPLTLLSIVPLGANTVIMASLMQSYPEKAATAVLISTLLALFYVPVMVKYFVCPEHLFD